jgi:hypothetical protein
MRVILAILVLASATQATELYWDDGEDYSSVMNPYLGVRFFDDDGEGRPGDTGGQPGTVSVFSLQCRWGIGQSQPEIYIFEGGWGGPGEILDGPLAYTLDPGGPWYRFILDEPVDVPGDFFAVVEPVFIWIYLDIDISWDSERSYEYSGGEWQACSSDLLLRVEWEPRSGAETVSWGEIKAWNR